MRRSVLASQFIAGLRNDVKMKLAGMEGDVERLLVYVWFEEAKLWDLGPNKGTTTGEEKVHQWSKT